MKIYVFSTVLVLLMACGSIKDAPVDEIYGEAKVKDKTDYSDLIKSLNSEYEVNYINGVSFKSYTKRGVNVVLTLEKDHTEGIKRHFTVRIAIQNESGGKFNFSEDNIDAYYQYKDKYGKLVKYDHKMVEKKLKNAKMWADIGRGLSEAASSYNESLSYTSETDVQVKDKIGNDLGSIKINTRDMSKINENRDERQKTLSSIDNEESSYIRKTVNEYLKINTIHNNEQFFSFVYFNRPKTDKVWITINILDEEFMFDWDLID